MYKVDIRVTAQKQENYNWAQGGDPYWKNKGGAEFILKGIDSDDTLYATSGEVDRIIQEMLNDKSGDYIKYTLLSWELIWFTPIELDSNVFNERLGVGVS
jgi:hypothetical protein